MYMLHTLTPRKKAIVRSLNEQINTKTQWVSFPELKKYKVSSAFHQPELWIWLKPR